MPEGQWTGLLTVIAAGVSQGSFMLPMKWTRRWEWENTWLIFAFSAYLLCPWILVLSTIPHVFDIYRSAGSGTIVAVILFGVGWGFGAVTFGLGVAAVGLALGFAIILGLAACAGTLVPLLLLSGGNLPAGRAGVTAASLVLMLSGVVVCSFAGKWKEKSPEAQAPLSYRKGVAVCVISGILSACGNLGFVYGRDIADRAESSGVPSYLAPNLIWALLTLALFVCNAGYSVLLLRRRGSAVNFTRPGTRAYFLFGMLMGVLWMAGFVLYGFGARQLGELGPSLGWAILMSVMVLAANLLGIATGEWRGAPRSAGRRLAAGLALLIVAIAGLGYANQMQANQPGLSVVRYDC